MNLRPLDEIGSSRALRSQAGKYRFLRCGEGFALASELRIPAWSDSSGFNLDTKWTSIESGRERTTRTRWRREDAAITP